jgi:cytochrome c oxidase subunit 2
MLLLSGCGGRQSAFSVFGVEAESTRTLTFIMSAAAAAITFGMVWLAVHAARAPAGQLDFRAGIRVILWLGAIGPTVLLTALLIFSLPRMRTLPVAEDDLRIAVDGEQFWWRVRYRSPGAGVVETANEIRIPVGRTVAFELGSPDVIHSFWIPGLAGKVDMIPGRTNELVVRATATGSFRGVCAEFCGLSHARMAFDVIAMAPDEFDAWLKKVAGGAGPASSEGQRLFESYGCGSCHTVRGHVEDSRIGPDLTHLGARRSLGAGALPMTTAAIAAFVRNPATSKPGALMPAFPMMTPADAEAIADYLVALR